MADELPLVDGDLAADLLQCHCLPEPGLCHHLCIALIITRLSFGSFLNGSG